MPRTTKPTAARKPVVRKAVVAKAPKVAASEPRTAPSGKLAQVAQLCMRPQGASPAELFTLTGWHRAPWRWLTTSNKNGTGLADKYGYGHRTEKVEGVTRYFLTQPSA